MQHSREAIDEQARAAWQGGNYEVTATLIFEAYGAELLSFLWGRLGSESTAKEVYSQFWEDLWVGLRTFEWRCSIRAWAYTLARNAAYRFVQAAPNRADRHTPLSQVPILGELIERSASAPPWARTDVKDKMQELRACLPPDDQDLIILRVDRDLSWVEVAQAMQPSGQVLSPAEAERVAARLRKRFQEAKRRLRDLAEQEGLLGGDEE